MVIPAVVALRHSVQTNFSNLFVSVLVVKGEPR